MNEHCVSEAARRQAIVAQVEHCARILHAAHPLDPLPQLPAERSDELQALRPSFVAAREEFL